jgi:hypothetical protein
MTSSEFSCRISVSQLGQTAIMTELCATAEQRSALAVRFGLAAIDSFSAQVSATRDVEGVHLTGQVTADVQYFCRVTSEAFPATLSEPLNILLLQGVTDDDLPDPVEAALIDHPVEVLALHGEEMDIGALCAETLGLAIDPFPRGPGADDALKQLGILSEEEARLAASPFAFLSKATDKG